MRKQILAKTFLGFWLALAAGAASAAHDRGNGGDKAPTTISGEAWFLGDRRVRTCAVVDPGFGIDESHAVAALQRAFTAWSDYVQTKHVYRPQDQLHLAMTPEIMKACDGTQDLTMYFGTDNPVVRAAATELQLNSPVAFAYREAYDPAKGWATGAFIWVARGLSLKDDDYNLGPFPDWTVEPNLLGTLIHELGHVFGNDHVPGTIMDEGLYDRLAFSRWLRKNGNEAGGVKMMATIDDQRELFLCMECGFSYDGVVGNDDIPGTTMKLLTGQTAPIDPGQGPVPKAVKATLTATALHIEAPNGPIDLPIRPVKGMSAYFGAGTKVFLRYGTDSTVHDQGLTAVESRERTGIAYVGTLTTVSGEQLPVIIGRNSDDVPEQEVFPRPITATFLWNGEKHELFEANASY